MPNLGHRNREKGCSFKSKNLRISIFIVQLTVLEVIRLQQSVLQNIHLTMAYREPQMWVPVIRACDRAGGKVSTEGTLWKFSTKIQVLCRIWLV